MRKRLTEILLLGLTRGFHETFLLQIFLSSNLLGKVLEKSDDRILYMEADEVVCKVVGMDKIPDCESTFAVRHQPSRGFFLALH